MKVCTSCKKSKELIYFVKDKRKLTGVGAICLKCERQRSQQRRDNNKELDSFYKRQWKKNNKEKVNAQWAKDRASKLNASVSWADQKYIEDLYKNCREAEDIFNNAGLNIKFHVDHIVPLQHDKVCGLHVEHNLQILTSDENARKSNKYEVI